MKVEKRLSRQSLQEIKQIAIAISEKLKGGEVIALYGDLGVGKTQIAKYMGEALGVKTQVSSPTFVFQKSYKGTDFGLAHFDMYRIDEEISKEGLIRELEDIDYYDSINDKKSVPILIDNLDSRVNLPKVAALDHTILSNPISFCLIATASCLSTLTNLGDIISISYIGFNNN